MTRFYDAKDEADLARVEEVLKKGGIEYFIASNLSGAGIANEIDVAEEDIPAAQELIEGSGSRGFRR